MTHERKSGASMIRDVLKSSAKPLSVDDLVDRLSSSGMTKAQVKTACFEMVKHNKLTKCGTPARQLFKIGTGIKTPRFNVPIAPSQDVPVAPACRSVESVEEWKRRTGRDIQRLPMGASAFPLWRIVQR